MGGRGEPFALVVIATSAFVTGTVSALLTVFCDDDARTPITTPAMPIRTSTMITTALRMPPR